MKTRSLPEDFPFKIRTSSAMTLILIQNDSNETFFENSSPNGKDELLSHYSESEGDTLLLAWTGKYKTDIFLIDEVDIEKHYR